MITYRILPPEEWDRLQQHPDLAAWVPDPAHAVILVAEDGDRIVGRMMAITMVHIEGTWTHPDYRRKTSIAYRLLTKMKEVLASFRVPKAYCWADRADVSSYLTRLGLEHLPVESFVMDIP